MNLSASEQGSQHVHSQKKGLNGQPKNSTGSIGELIGQSLKTVAPAWPLQNSVAVNPFWFNHDRPLIDVFSELRYVLNQSVFMPSEYYLERYRVGEITRDAIDLALKKTRSIWNFLPESSAEFISKRYDDRTGTWQCQVLADLDLSEVNLKQKSIEDLGKYCAAYFDDKQALVSHPWQSGSFWQGWFEAQKFDKTMEKLGVAGFASVVSIFRHMTARQAIEFILVNIGLESNEARYLYMQKLLASTIGWASQFKYLEWQKSLGHSPTRTSNLEEFLAVRMIYDFAAFKTFMDIQPERVKQWVDITCEAAMKTSQVEALVVQQYVWQLAYEFSYQDKLARELRAETSEKLDSIDIEFQLVFCIDVRSELLRSSLERQNPGIQTFGFAGFFGAPIKYQSITENDSGHRLPVLLSPEYDLKEMPKSDSVARTSERLIERMYIMSYFKNLRKASIGSFLYVEIFGILAVGALCARTIKTALNRLFRRRSVDSYQSESTKPMIAQQSLQDKVSRAKAILSNLGLTKSFGKIVVFCGHGSQTTNNALSSSLDCGACGGHSGDANARFVANLLNDLEVRTKLVDEGIEIPIKTHFTAAIHETVTDRVILLDQDQAPKSLLSDLNRIQHHLDSATALATKKRSVLRSKTLDTDSERRSESWSEIRPEWGLAGNASFVVAPRKRTKGIDLKGRTFLHDYHHESDRDFKTLELIMTAPMIVTNWINLQYFASVTAPDYFGCGNKLLHNLVGESGVLEGNGGDLRVGLAHQSIHDGHQYTHEPLRLSVFIEAPRAAIEGIISKHKLVRDLVENEWLFILHLEPSTKNTFRRTSNGVYEELAF